MAVFLLLGEKMEYFLQSFNSFYEVLWVFIIYSFLGWCSEVAYAALETGSFVNRGFLNGPVCPIYGSGIVIVVSILTPLKTNLLILFLGSVILTTLLELIVGWGMETIFHHQWWDYSMLPFNFKGYICLKFSILWGLACTLVMDIVHPIIMKPIGFLPKREGIFLLVILFGLFIADCVITVSNIFKFNRKLVLLEEIQQQLDKISVGIGENIYEGVSEAMEVSDKVKENMAERKEELTKHYQELIEEKEKYQIRILKAFPNLKSKRYSISLEKIKKARGIIPSKLRIKRK